ncbi:hypothetical protein K438DRAFT_2029361 [Mycena galopus ATCC 62051]|nr:hypothetical protein K438DRAFT_2029361 [Mycena galopus ATCC 62051]
MSDDPDVQRRTLVDGDEEDTAESSPLKAAAERASSRRDRATDTATLTQAVQDREAPRRCRHQRCGQSPKTTDLPPRMQHPAASAQVTATAKTLTAASTSAIPIDDDVGPMTRATTRKRNATAEPSASGY